MIDTDNIPMQPVDILVGVEPKVKCKNLLLQKLMIKLFGYKTKYEKKMGKVITIKADDYPVDELKGDFKISFDE